MTGNENDDDANTSFDTLDLPQLLSDVIDEKQGLKVRHTNARAQHR